MTAPRYLTDHDRARITQMAEEGIGQQAIARELGVSQSAVAGYLRDGDPPDEVMGRPVTRFYGEGGAPITLPRAPWEL